SLCDLSRFVVALPRRRAARAGAMVSQTVRRGCSRGDALCRRGIRRGYLHLFVSRIAASDPPRGGGRDPPGAPARRHADLCGLPADRRRTRLRRHARAVSHRLSRALLRELSARGPRPAVEPRLHSRSANSGVFLESAELPPRSKNFLTKI